MQRRKQTAIDVTVAVAKSESFVRHVTRKFCKNKKVFRMKDFFCTHFSIRIVFLITHAWKQEFPHPRSSQYLLQKYLKCFTVYSTSAHYRYDFRENTLLQKPHKICRVLKRLCCTASTSFNICFQPSVFCGCVASGKSFCPSLSL